MNYTVIIPAAGQGKRMNAGKNKQFLMLKNRPLIVHTLTVFEKDSWCNEIILIANENELEDMQQLASDYQITKVKQIVSGGSERQYSVANGLENVDPNKIVLVHDGARPFIKETHIHKAVLKADQVGAAVVAVRVKDTIKRVNSNSVIEETIDRSSLWAIQTPQAFRGAILHQAFKEAIKENYLGTDDASLVEKMGGMVAVVEGDYLNIKITTQEDLIFAEAILTRMGE